MQLLGARSISNATNDINKKVNKKKKKKKKRKKKGMKATRINSNNHEHSTAHIYI